MAARTTWTTVGLLAVCGGLILTIMLEVADELHLAPGVTAASRSAPEIVLPEPVAYTPPLAERFSIISTRPLFSESRRPYVPPAEDSPEPEAGPEFAVPQAPVDLVGVLLSDKGRAALLSAEGASAVWRHEGQTFDGWTLETVMAEEATLRRGDEIMTLKLRSD